MGSNYFRIHPKGVGLLCAREEGLPPLTFVEEYLGEVHAPWRWFDKQVSRYRNAPCCCHGRIAEARGPMSGLRV